MHTVYVTKATKTALNVYLLAEVDSTNEILKTEQKYNAFDVVIAGRQTKGRGRGGSEFVSDEGGLYLSILLKDDGIGEYITPLAGVAVVNVLRGLGLDPKIKWVNDVFVGGRKICGILAERISRGDGDYIVQGIGINVNNTAFGSFSSIATSVVIQTARVNKLSDVAGLLLDELMRLIKTRSKAEVMDAYRDYSLAIGQRVTVAGSGETADAIGIDDDGHLILRDKKGKIKTLSAGSIRLADNITKTL